MKVTDVKVYPVKAKGIKIKEICHVTFDEVEALYSSGERPDINAEIDYILGDN